MTPLRQRMIEDLTGFLRRRLPNVLDFAGFAEAMGADLSSNEAVTEAIAEYTNAQAASAA